MFDSFVREHNSTESKISGTGLGLSIVKRIVDLMGGTIEVESELGKGTKFTITLSHRICGNPQADKKVNSECLADMRDMIRPYSYGYSDFEYGRLQGDKGDKKTSRRCQGKNTYCSDDCKCF